MDVAGDVSVPEFRADRPGIALRPGRTIRTSGTVGTGRADFALRPLRAGSRRAPDTIAGAVIGQHVAVTAAGNIHTVGIKRVRFGGQQRARRQFRAGIDGDAELVRLVKRQADRAAGAGADHDGEQTVDNDYAAVAVGVYRATATRLINVELQSYGAGDPGAAGVLEHALVGDRLGDLGFGDSAGDQQADDEGD